MRWPFRICSIGSNDKPRSSIIHGILTRDDLERHMQCITIATFQNWTY